MIPYSIYKIIHFVGIFMIFISVGGVATHVINGGQKTHQWRIGIAITHGVGMFLALLGGFGLLARLGIAHGGFPGWVYAKLTIWLIFGGITAILVRRPNAAKPVWFGCLALGLVAAYLAGSKPL